MTVGLCPSFFVGYRSVLFGACGFDWLASVGWDVYLPVGFACQDVGAALPKALRGSSLRGDGLPNKNGAAIGESRPILMDWFRVSA
jgi:hypothetical protein